MVARLKSLHFIKIAVCFSQNEEAFLFFGVLHSKMWSLLYAYFEELRYYSRKLQTFLSTRMFLANLPTIENWHLKNMVCVAISE